MGAGGGPAGMPAPAVGRVPPASPLGACLRQAGPCSLAVLRGGQGRHWARGAARGEGLLDEVRAVVAAYDAAAAQDGAMPAVACSSEQVWSSRASVAQVV